MAGATRLWLLALRRCASVVVAATRRACFALQRA